ncbi:hypothetical protein AYO20_07889 [Fonsecaea nubica]|uniref:Alpha/beta hydrolase fold-3 domain-containing protein n=1 Tax=Fonsecaea nubica TaxID=856822 RepID=A0A178CRW3_9EURO|nr:hypothetical protein AYO20_07889 [Fonsecaea nubica]OAL32579.1 hypothetical protein AYO20_07889 [Fonsecaea nubica]
MSPESQAIVDVFGFARQRMMENPNMSAREGRLFIESFGSLASEPTEVTYEEVQCPGSTGPAIWCRPSSADPSHIILYLHGGAGTGGSPSSHRKLAGHLAKVASCVALLPDYRLVPEDPFPAGLEDCLSTYKWVLDQGFKPSRIAVAGDSAGANLTAALLLKLKEQGLSFPGAAALLSPWLDMENLGESRQFNFEHDALAGLATASTALYCQGTSPKNPFANPLYGDFTGAPPLFVSAGGWDTLLSDALTLAEKAKAVGVDVTLHVAPEMQHDYHFMVGRAPEATETVTEIGRWIAGKLQ